jgi:poly-gamma-glutamate synthesis protein (capsule biosynthesis protein)
VFAGDTNGEADGPTDLAERLAPFARRLRRADFAMVNLEAAIARSGEPADKPFTFRVPPSALWQLASVGVDAVSMANNHALDYGPQGLSETLQAKRGSPVAIVGVGADEEEAFAPHIFTAGDTSVGVVAATQVIDSSVLDWWTATPERGGAASARDVERLVEAVVAADRFVEVVVVFLHWGVEQQRCPVPAQTDLARVLVAAGADVVVGTHAHRVQGGGRLDGAVVHYGLGNFGFRARNALAAETGVFEVTVAGGEVTGYAWVQGRIDSSVPEPLEGREAAAASEAWEDLRDCTDLEP